jgi:hypothetical protein
MQLFHKRLKKIESWPNKILAWANWRRFNIPMDRYEEYIPCYSAPAVHWSFLPVTWLANRKILFDQILKGGQDQHSMYLASWV